MLKKQNRLARISKKSNASFFNSAFFNIRVSDNKEKEPRFGIVVSKKTSKKAVFRNKTKRIIRNIIAESLEKFSKNKDIIIVAKRIVNKTVKKDAEAELLDLFTKAKIIK